MVVRTGRSVFLSLLLAGAIAAFAQNPTTTPPLQTEGMQGLEGAKKLMQQQLGWDLTAAMGKAKLIAKERSRTKGDQGTVIRYDLMTEGLPQDQHYTLVMWPLNGGIQPVKSGISLTEDGRLICTGKTTADCSPNRPDADPIIDMSLTSAKGEAKRFGLISEDQKTKALVSLVAFPNKGTDAGCTLEVLRVTPEAEALMIRGKGFPANAELPMTSDSDGEVVSGLWHTTDKGDLVTLVMPAVRGKTSGQVTVRVKAPACTPQVSFPWGKGTYHPE